MAYFEVFAPMAFSVVFALLKNPEHSAKFRDALEKLHRVLSVTLGK